MFLHIFARTGVAEGGESGVGGGCVGSFCHNWGSFCTGWGCVGCVGCGVRGGCNRGGGKTEQ